MKKTIRFTALLLAMVSIFSVFGAAAFADGLRTGSEMFEGVSKSEKDMEKVMEIYEDITYRAYIFDEDIALPELEHMNEYDDIKIKYVQTRKGFAYTEALYTAPYKEADRPWAVTDATKVKVYAKYRDFSFVEVMLNKNESEGTIGWIPTAVLVDNWSSNLSVNRANCAG